MIQKKYYKLVRVSYDDSAMFRMTNISDQVGHFSVAKVNSPTAPDMEYSTDGVTWTAYDFTNRPTVAVPAGGNIYLRGNNSSGFNRNTSHYFTLTMDVNHNIGGNICSLIDKTDPASVTTLPDVCFSGLFFGETNIVSASNMNFGNVEIVGIDSLYQAFYNCTSLSTPPDLSNIKEIKGSISGGLYQAFYNCTSLSTPPDLSNLTTIWRGGMTNCFENCTSLTTGPDLSNLIYLKSNNGEFANCFRNCYNLSSVTTPNIDTWSTSAFNNWLNNAGTQATGTKTVYKPAALSIPTSSNSGVPNGWTTANY